MLQFSIKQLFLALALVAICAALIADEPLRVGMAAVFAAISTTIIVTLGFISLSNLWRQLKKSVSERSWRPMVSRIKWLMVDMIILVWLLAIICVVNYILDNSVSLAQWLLLIGLLISPFSAWKILVYRPL